MSFKSVASIFPVKSSKVGRKHAETFGSKIQDFGSQMGTLLLPPDKIARGFHRLEPGFLKKIIDCVTTWYSTDQLSR